ncbi:hypothetical protein KP509_1Z279300 [Ceratopteris richardii]|nr:hypothetical protein KP509_1Z279300 [Ceratopteris richardii]
MMFSQNFVEAFPNPYAFRAALAFEDRTLQVGAANVEISEVSLKDMHQIKMQLSELFLMKLVEKTGEQKVERF